ncbi:MAG: ABC transporter permease [Anaerolineae bacterium]|nr:ABC transporter permease [Anaerolineae bacterium]
MESGLVRTWALTKKELTQLVRDRGTFALILFLPVVELLLFAYAVSLTVDHIPTAVADLSLDAQSQAFVDALTVSGFFDVTLWVQDEAQVIRAIDEGVVRAGIVIPPDFASQTERGGAQVLILLDGSDSFTVQSGYSAAAAIAQARATQMLLEQFGRAGARGGGITLPVVTASHILYNPDMDDMVFLVPAIAAAILQLMSLGLTAMAVVRERELGTIEQLLVTPARPLELMIAKMVPNLLVSVFNLVFLMALSVFWFGVPFQGNVWLFGWLSLIFLASGLGMGLLISTIAKTQKQAQELTMLMVLLSLLLTGFIYPREPMPPVVRAVGNLIPLTYFIRIARGIITKGIGLEFLWTDALALVFYGVLMLILASVTFKKRLD